VLIALSCKEVKSGGWTYGDITAWSTINIKCSTGTEQSPIDIKRLTVVENTTAGE